MGINLKKTWEKLVLAARAIAAVENPQDVYVVASRPYAQRAVLKFARYVGCSSIAGRFTPGAFTNQIQAAFREPRLLLICDPRCCIFVGKLLDYSCLLLLSSTHDSF